MLFFPNVAVARFDISWGDAEYHQETLDNLKAAIKSTKKLCAVSILNYWVFFFFFLKIFGLDYVCLLTVGEREIECGIYVFLE